MIIHTDSKTIGRYINVYITAPPLTLKSNPPLVVKLLFTY